MPPNPPQVYPTHTHLANKPSNATRTEPGDTPITQTPPKTTNSNQHAHPTPTLDPKHTPAAISTVTQQPPFTLNTYQRPLQLSPNSHPSPKTSTSGHFDCHHTRAVWNVPYEGDTSHPHPPPAPDAATWLQKTRARHAGSPEVPQTATGDSRPPHADPP